MSDPTSGAISKFLDKHSPITLSKLIIETQAPLILLFASLFIPSIILYVSINKFAVNIPIWDDYDIFLNYLNLTGDERLKFMFVHHNEHKVVFERFCAEVLYQLTGTINFRQLAFFGNLALLFILSNEDLAKPIKASGIISLNDQQEK